MLAWGDCLHRGRKSRFGSMMALRIVCVGKPLKTQVRCTPSSTCKPPIVLVSGMAHVSPFCGAGARSRRDAGAFPPPHPPAPGRLWLRPRLGSSWRAPVVIVGGGALFGAGDVIFGRIGPALWWNRLWRPPASHRVAAFIFSGGQERTQRRAGSFPRVCVGGDGLRRQALESAWVWRGCRAHHAVLRNSGFLAPSE
jgi:hypothetical protein